MIDWKPDLESAQGPMYERIARALERDIRNGKLQSGDRLPAQRVLAKQLGVTVGTVSRALQEAIRIGLVDADGRRGTTVLPIVAKAEYASSPARKTGVIDLRGHGSVLPDWGVNIRKILKTIAHTDAMDDMFVYHQGPGHLLHRQAMAQWLAKMTGEAVDPARLIITNGAQHALLCAILATCKSGDTLACEQLTYAGLKVVAPTLGIHLLPLAMDRDGIIPEELARACAANSIRGLVCVPNLQNPTTITMPAERRERIAHIARSNNIVVIEDDVYGALAQNGLPALRTFYPEGVLTLTGISKSLGPGLRVGAVIAAEQYHPGLTNAVRATAWMASPIDVSVVVEMMHTGLADDIVARNQDELKKRALIVSDALAMLGCHVDSRSPHAWLELPEPWTKEQFLTWLASAHIQALPSDTFVVGREFVSHAVRLSLTCLKDRSELQDAVRRIAIALQNGPAQSMLMA